MSKPAQKIRPANIARLAEAELKPDVLAVLLAAGMHQDDAVTVAITRHAQGWSARVLRFDAVIYKVHPDPGLLIRITEADLETESLVDVYADTCHLTRDALETCLDAGIDVRSALTWAHIGRPFTELAQAVAGRPDWDRAAIVRALQYGANPSDLDWLAGNGVNLTAAGALSELTGQLNAASSAQARRLTLVLLIRHQYNMSAARAVATLIADTETADVTIRLIADGTDPADAIELARADAAVERRLAITRRDKDRAHDQNSATRTP
jgi:hypothetical protein